MPSPAWTRPATVVPVACAVVAIAAAAFAFTASETSPAEAQTVPATCTNSNSDAATIQNTIDNSKPGDEIVIHGPCLITATIKLAGDRTYRGDSRSTVVKAANGSNLPAVLASDSWATDSTTTGNPIQLRDLTVDGNAVNNPTGGDGIVIRSWQTTVEDLHIHDSPKNGIRLTNLSLHNKALQNTQVNGTMRNLFIENSGANGIYVQDSGNSLTDWSLTDNWIADSKLDAIRSENGAGWTIERNHVYDDGQNGINVDRLFSTSISDNYVEDFTKSAITTNVQGDTASTINGNRLFQRGTTKGGSYLHVTGVNYGTGNVVVNDNAIYGNNTGTGLLYERGSNQLNVVSNGNLVSGVATVKTTASGVKITTGS